MTNWTSSGRREVAREIATGVEPLGFELLDKGAKAGSLTFSRRVEECWVDLVVAFPRSALKCMVGIAHSRTAALFLRRGFLVAGSDLVAVLRGV